MEEAKPFHEDSSAGPKLLPFPPSSTQETSTKSTSLEESNEFGRLLAEQFSQRNIYPVLLFGGPHSGKSTLLASLLRFLKTESAWGPPTLLPVIEDREVPYAEELDKLASRFFHHTEKTFRREDAAPIST